MGNIELEVAGEDIHVGHFTVQEAMSAAFRIHVIGRGRADTDIRSSIGRKARFELRSNRGARTWHGVVSNISQTVRFTPGAHVTRKSMSLSGR